MSSSIGNIALSAFKALQTESVFKAAGAAAAAALVTLVALRALGKEEEVPPPPGEPVFGLAAKLVPSLPPPPEGWDPDRFVSNQDVHLRSKL